MAKKETLKLVNIRVKPSLWAEVNRVAEARGLGLSEAAREALTEYVQRNYRLLGQSSGATPE
jgi:predicted HicB family RNase H-like nuclease